VVGCSVGVHVLNHGLQLGGGAVLLSAAVAAFQSSDTDAGTWHVETENSGTWYVETGKLRYVGLRDGTRMYVTRKDGRLRYVGRREGKQIFGTQGG